METSYAALHGGLMQIMAASPGVRQASLVDRPDSASVSAAVSGTATRRAHDRGRYPRLARELKTMRAMIRIHCRDRHATRAGLCGECLSLMGYATRRIDRCAFGDDKPTCANCKVHCYNAEMRERIRTVMRYAGPRMLWRHPILAIAHIVDGRREAPELPRRQQRARDPSRATRASAGAKQTEECPKASPVTVFLRYHGKLE